MQPSWSIAAQAVTVYLTGAMPELRAQSALMEPVGYNGKAYGVAMTTRSGDILRRLIINANYLAIYPRINSGSLVPFTESVACLS
jgi:hypothetical protein